MKYIIYLMIILCAGSVRAQDRFINHLETELGDGLCFPLGNYHDGNGKPGWSLISEFRYNFSDQPWDCGIFTQFDTAKRKFDGGTQKNETVSFGVLGKYNFREGKDVNPYISVGVGTGYHDISGYEYLPTSGWSAVFIPKIGIEFWGGMTISSYCQISRKGYNSVVLCFGWVFGRGTE